VALTTCPRSFITGESLALVESFLTRRKFGPIAVAELTAREAEAFVILESLLEAEIRNGQQNSRHTF
jgi:hypothetical protein